MGGARWGGPKKRGGSRGARWARTKRDGGWGQPWGRARIKGREWVGPRGWVEPDRGRSIEEKRGGSRGAGRVKRGQKGGVGPGGKAGCGRGKMGGWDQTRAGP